MNRSFRLKAATQKNCTSYLRSTEMACRISRIPYLSLSSIDVALYMDILPAHFTFSDETFVERHFLCDLRKAEEKRPGVAPVIGRVSTREFATRAIEVTVDLATNKTHFCS